jgi:hypothetical protein
MDEQTGLEISGQNEETFAWQFRMTLPLKAPFPLD